MPFPLFGLIGGMAAIRGGHALAKTFGSNFLRGPLIQGGQFGVGYTGGSYLGYGGSNTIDPFGIHNKKSYKSGQSRQFRMPYGYGYGRRRYRRRYSRYSRYSGYRRYSRYSQRRRYY